MHVCRRSADHAGSGKRAITMPTDGEMLTEDEQAVITVISDALCHKFGGRALAIARDQAASAVGDPRTTWLAIVAQLEARTPER